MGCGGGIGAGAGGTAHDIGTTVLEEWGNAAPNAAKPITKPLKKVGFQSFPLALTKALVYIGLWLRLRAVFGTSSTHGRKSSSTPVRMIAGLSLPGKCTMCPRG